jgi:hypothetical protein
MLYKPVAWASKRGKLCIKVDAQGRMSFCLFDHDLCYVNMASKARALQITPRSTDKVVGELDPKFGDFDPTFGDLNGKEVKFPKGSMMRPSKSLLALHTYASWLKAWSLHPDIKFPIPQHIFSDNEGKGTDRVALGYSIRQWVMTVHPGLHVSGSRQSPCHAALTCLVSMLHKHNKYQWLPDKLLYPQCLENEEQYRLYRRRLSLLLDGLNSSSHDGRLYPNFCHITGRLPVWQPTLA